MHKSIPPCYENAFVTSEKTSLQDNGHTYPQLVPCREAPLYKGQWTYPQLVPCREAPLYKGQWTCPQLVPCREAPLYKGQWTYPQLVPCREAPLYIDSQGIFGLGSRGTITTTCNCRCYRLFVSRMLGTM